MRLLECAQRRTVRQVQRGEFEGACGVAATARIELGAVIGKRKRMLRQERLESSASGREMQRGLVGITCGLRNVGEAPRHFGVAAFKYRREQRLASSVRC